MAQYAVAPVIVESPNASGRWSVVIYNNEVNAFDDVIAILMRSTGCGAQEAYFEVWEAHTYGKAPVHFSDRTECEIIANMIGTIGVRTEVCREWQEL